MTIIESLISLNGIYMLSDTKNRTVIAGSGKTMSSIVEFPTFIGGY
jgi:hypothetical protein